MKSTRPSKILNRHRNYYQKSLVNDTDHYNHDQQQQYFTMLIDSFKNQIDSLKVEVYSLQEEIREKNVIIKHLLQTKHVNLKSNETTNNQPINNMNVILHELDKTNRSGNDLSKTLINFDESICDDKLNSPASQKMLDHNNIDNSDKKNIKYFINLGNNDINAKHNEVNSNPSSYNVVSGNALND